jgi:hypothetical protein
MVMNRGLQEDVLKRMAGESADHLDSHEIDSTLSLPENIDNLKRQGRLQEPLEDRADAAYHEEKMREAHDRSLRLAGVRESLERQREKPRVVSVKNTKPSVVSIRDLGLGEVRAAQKWEERVGREEKARAQVAEVELRGREFDARTLARAQSDAEFRERITQSKPARLLGNAGFMLAQAGKSIGNSIVPAFTGVGGGLVGFFSVPRVGGGQARVNPFAANQGRGNPFTMQFGGQRREVEYERIRVGGATIVRPVRRPVEQAAFGPGLFGRGGGGTGFGASIFAGGRASKKRGFWPDFFGGGRK